MASATRVACNKEGNGNGGKSNGNKDGRQAMATRAIATVKANINQPATGLTMAGGGWQESIDKATTRPQQWVRDNKQQERAADDDGSSKEGKGGKGDGDHYEDGRR